LNTPRSLARCIAKRALRVAVVILLLAAIGLAFVVQPAVQPLPSEPPAVDVGRLRTHVHRLSVDFYPRSYEQIDNTERSAQYILDALQASGGDVSAQDVEVEGVTYRNIIARFGPTTGPVLIIGAHYDSHGNVYAGSSDPRGYSPDSHTPGADDNASGVAGLLELGYLLGAHPPTRQVELVAYALEEPPHFRTAYMGSDRHANSMRDERRDVALMISLEMIGYFSDEPHSQRYPVPGMSLLYPDRGNFVAVVGRLADFGATRRINALMAGATDLPVRSINAPSAIPGIDFSDHLNYWRLGFPAFMVTDTAFLRNTNYHAATDTAETLDYARMAKVVRAVYAVAQAY
jgi:Zn-dependent M28 family amino/carboxypeptidase